MSNNLYKANWVMVGDDARVIDVEELSRRKLEEAMLERQKRAAYAEENQWTDEDGFAEGLAAENVDALFDEDGEGAVLKSAVLAEQEKVNAQLEEAKAELERVREQSEQMLAKAQDEIEGLKQQALQEAQEQGYQEGYQNGMREAEALKDECRQKEKQLEEAFQQKIEELEPMFIETLTGIYEHIFKVDLSAYQSLIENLLIDALQKTDSARNYIIHVSKEDYPEICKQKERIQEEAGASAAGFEFISDMTLFPSQCMIETENGIFDCSLGTELEELSRKLKLLSYKGGD